MVTVVWAVPDALVVICFNSVGVECSHNSNSVCGDEPVDSNKTVAPASTCNEPLSVRAILLPAESTEYNVVEMPAASTVIALFARETCVATISFPSRAADCSPFAIARSGA